MRIKVKEVEPNVEIKKQAGGTYPGHRVVFEDNGEVKTKGFHEKVLGFRTDLKEAIESMEAGQWYEVQMEKNDKGYWDWVSIEPASEGSSQPPQKGSQQTSQGSQKGGYDTTGVAVGHSLTNAVNLCAAMGEADKEKIKEYAYMIYDLSMEMQSEIRNGNRDKDYKKDEELAGIANEHRSTGDSNPDDIPF